MSFDLVEKLKKEIDAFRDDTKFEEVGFVAETGDGIVKITGLNKARSQEVLSVETSAGEVLALAANLEDNLIGAIILGNFEGVKAGDRVKKTGKILSVMAGDELLGRVINSTGEPIDGKGVIFSEGNFKEYFLERGAPSVVEREPVKVPLHTGIKAIDAMIPIGRGQRELIIGDRQTGKTSIALDAILNQKSDKGRPQAVCIYVAIGQKDSKVAKILKILEEKGAKDYTVVVSASASQPASQQYLAPFAGCAVGEYFMDRGKDVLIVYDDLSKHADAYRQLSLLLRRPPGREAYPGDIFYLHARLLERSAKLSPEKGGGSLTALPIIETKLGDVSAYIPTNVISITDGQIYLESDIFYQGIRPAINAGLSVSRVGSSAQTKAMKKVAGKLRLELAQFRELKAFTQFASDLDENTRKKIKKGEALTEILKQSDLEPRPFEEEVAVIYAAVEGFLDDLAQEKIPRFEKEFLDYLKKLHQKDVLDEIQKSGELGKKTEENLKNALAGFKAIF